ncbi:hypothetical protein HPB48_021660 [Haemaphysalis longicornis]|uniref:Uncharacterized protein n=1 Tax=Haemaphysalis longicornis TaxID=44386 RepID=A0A9J6F6P3_HAELO|nr:hypothetical protein HPB48_021660 [Haemaphysalis longicornis]
MASLVPASAATTLRCAFTRTSNTPGPAVSCPAIASGGSDGGLGLTSLSSEKPSISASVDTTPDRCHSSSSSTFAVCGSHEAFPDGREQLDLPAPRPLPHVDRMHAYARPARPGTPTGASPATSLLPPRGELPENGATWKDADRHPSPAAQSGFPSLLVLLRNIKITARL